MSAPQVPIFSAASSAAAPGIDLDGLDFQMLNDYLFEDPSPSFARGASVPHGGRGGGGGAAGGITRRGAPGGGRGGRGRGESAAAARKKSEKEELDELEGLGSTDEDEEDGDGKRLKLNLDGQPKTQQQIDRRRERNRILARRTRLRKKFFFESLQKQVLEFILAQNCYQYRRRSRDAFLIRNVLS